MLGIVLQEPDLTTENVHRSAVQIYARFLSKYYFMDLCKDFELYLFGWCVARPRQFIRFRHKHKILSEISPLAAFSKSFYHACNWGWTEFFLLLDCPETGIIPTEPEVELAWAASRATSLAKGKDRITYAEALTGTEAMYASEYEASWP